MANFNITINEQTREIVGETVSIGDLLYLATDSKWYLADASLVSKSSTELRLALQAGIADSEIDMLVHGYVDLSPFVLAPGTKYYVSNTAGEITTSLLTSNVVRYVGTAFDFSNFLFNPDQTYIHDSAKKINNVPINISHTHTEYVDLTSVQTITALKQFTPNNSTAISILGTSTTSSNADQLITHNNPNSLSAGIRVNGASLSDGFLFTGQNNGTDTFTVDKLGNIIANSFIGLDLTVKPYTAKTANYTATSTDYTIECTANTFTITLPTAIGIVGKLFNIKNTGSGVITIDTNASEVIDNSSTILLLQWENITIQSNGSNWIII